MKKLDLLKLWALGLGIPLFVFEDERVKRSIEANDPHGCISDMGRALYEKRPEELKSVNLNEAFTNLDNPLYRLEFCSLMRQ